MAYFDLIDQLTGDSLLLRLEFRCGSIILALIIITSAEAAADVLIEILALIIRGIHSAFEIRRCFSPCFVTVLARACRRVKR